MKPEESAQSGDTYLPSDGAPPPPVVFDGDQPLTLLEYVECAVAVFIVAAVLLSVIALAVGGRS